MLCRAQIFLRMVVAHELVVYLQGEQAIWLLFGLAAVAGLVLILVFSPANVDVPQEQF